MNDAEPKTPDKSTTTGCIDLESIVGIKADHPLAVPKIVIPEEPKGLHAYFKRSWATVMLQIGDGSLPESLAIRISGHSLNSVCNAALLFRSVGRSWCSWISAPRNEPIETIR